ncbi:MAG: DUF2806 domain-containing protein [Bacteroidales bacterium]|nr:DUF2806 domain-containing protein [Bacteroidales bacterium]
MGLPVNVTLGLDKLVETVANATGLTALGTIINAHGEAKAQSILAKKKAESDAEVEILRMQGEEKVAQYVLARNTQKIENVGEIIAKAEQQFSPDEEVSNEPVDKDWMTRFLDIAETISDDEMQVLWARTLAGEVKKPGTYSLRTLDVLRNITKKEAELIVKASPFLLFDFGLLCIEKFALNLNDKISLNDMGIVCGEDLVRKCPVGKTPGIILLNKESLLRIYAPKRIIIEVKSVKLTTAGFEIMNMIQIHNDQKYISSLAAKIKSQGASKVTLHKIVSWDGTSYQYENNGVEI